MDKNNKRNDQGKELRHLDLQTSDAASSMECTGLIPAAPVNDAEQEAYEAIYAYGIERAEIEEEK